MQISFKNNNFILSSGGALLCIAGTAFAWLSWASFGLLQDLDDNGLWFAVALFGVFSFVFFVYAGRMLRTLMYGKSNSFTVTDTELIYSYNGTVRRFELGKIEALEEVLRAGNNRGYIMLPKYYIRFKYQNKYYDLGKSEYIKDFPGFVRILTSRINV